LYGNNTRPAAGTWSMHGSVDYWSTTSASNKVVHPIIGAQASTEASMTCVKQVGLATSNPAPCALCHA
jgi:hypothetical protein